MCVDRRTVGHGRRSGLSGIYGILHRRTTAGRFPTTIGQTLTTSRWIHNDHYTVYHGLQRAIEVNLFSKKVLDKFGTF